MVGQESNIPPKPQQRNNVRHDRLTLISLPGMQLTIPAGMVEDGLDVRPKVEEGRWSPRYTFASQSCPLFGWAELCFAIPEGVDADRLYIVSGGYDMGGVCQDGWITTYIQELGASYELKLKDEDE